MKSSELNKKEWDAISDVAMPDAHVGNAAAPHADAPAERI